MAQSEEQHPADAPTDEVKPYQLRVGESVFRISAPGPHFFFLTRQCLGVEQISRAHAAEARAYTTTS